MPSQRDKVDGLAPAEYRDLVPGEIIQEGDEFSAHGQPWEPSDAVGETYDSLITHFPHRRPVASPAGGSPAKPSPEALDLEAIEARVKAANYWIIEAMDHVTALIAEVRRLRGIHA